MGFTWFRFVWWRAGFAELKWLCAANFIYFFGDCASLLLLFQDRCLSSFYFSLLRTFSLSINVTLPFYVCLTPFLSFPPKPDKAFWFDSDLNRVQFVCPAFGNGAAAEMFQNAKSKLASLNPLRSESKFSPRRNSSHRVYSGKIIFNLNYSYWWTAHNCSNVFRAKSFVATMPLLVVFVLCWWEIVDIWKQSWTRSHKTFFSPQNFIRHWELTNQTSHVINFSFPNRLILV